MLFEHYFIGLGIGKRHMLSFTCITYIVKKFSLYKKKKTFTAARHSMEKIVTDN